LPYLKKIEEDNGSYTDKNVELALARYGEEPYYTNAIKKYAYGEEFRYNFIWNLEYICSRDSIEEIFNYIMNENQESCSSDGECSGYWAESGISILQALFNNKDYFNEINSLKLNYDIKDKIPDKAYLKKMRAITKKYYKQFKKQEPYCENVPVDAW
ncbi:MAG: hypothetical protein ACK5H1_06845, partial [Tenacibaculum sp.]